MRGVTSVIVTLLLFGCAAPQPKPDVQVSLDRALVEEKMAKEQLVQIERFKHARQDSLAFAERDSLVHVNERIAYGDILFGMSEKQVDKARKGMLDGYGKVVLGDASYVMRPAFTEDHKLYRLELGGYWYKQAAFSRMTDVAKAAQELALVIEMKYGPPTQKFPPIDYTQIETGFMKYMAQWQVGTKQISVGVVRHTAGPKGCSPEAWMIDMPLSEQVEAKIPKVKKQTKLETSRQF